MLTDGDEAPAFAAPAALPDNDIETVTLEDALASGSAVLAFFPGAFTSVCSGEMTTLRDRLEEFRAAGATLYGVSTDLPFALRAFADRHDLNFPLVGDTERRLVDAYGVRTEFESPAVGGLARRAVFVVDPDRTVIYAWVADDPTREPDYDAVVAAAVDA